MKYLTILFFFGLVGFQVLRPEKPLKPVFVRPEIIKPVKPVVVRPTLEIVKPLKPLLPL